MVGAFVGSLWACPCVPLAVVPVLGVCVPLAGVPVLCVCVPLARVPVLCARCVGACACRYGSPCTWAVASAARSLRMLLGSIWMRLLMQAFFVHLRTQAGHVCELAEFGCLRRWEVARGTAQSCFQLASSMHSAEGSDDSQQCDSNGSQWTRVESCKVRRDRVVEVCPSEHRQCCSTASPPWW